MVRIKFTGKNMTEKIKLNIYVSIFGQIANRHAYQLCVMKGDRLGASPARHALSDRRINSSHGNNIFIFQGQRFVFLPSSCQTVDDMFWAQAVRFGCRRNGRDAVYIKPTRERKEDKSWWKIGELLLIHSGKQAKQIPAQSGAGCRYQAADM